MMFLLFHFKSWIHVHVHVQVFYFWYRYFSVSVCDQSLVTHFTPWSLVYTCQIWWFWNWNLVNNLISTTVQQCGFTKFLYCSNWQVASSTEHSSQSSESYRWGLPSVIFYGGSITFLWLPVVVRSICSEGTLQVSQLWILNQVSKLSGFFKGGWGIEYLEGRGFIVVLIKRKIAGRKSMCVWGGGGGGRSSVIRLEQCKFRKKIMWSY